MKFSKAQRLVLSASLSVFLAGCGAPNYSPSEMHITVEEVESEQPAPRDIPSLVKASPTLPVLDNREGAETFDVIVTNVPVRDLLFALARDAGVNMDVDARVGGVVTMSALDQTLEAILERIAQQVDIRVDRLGKAMIIKPDEPYYKKYTLNYLNIERDFSSDAETSDLGDAGTAEIENESESDFWGELDDAIAAILQASPEVGGGAVAVGDESGLAEAADETEQRYSSESFHQINKEAGIVIVYAPARLQKEVEAYLDDVQRIAKRQVLLEATVVEVVLNNQYAQGIDWSIFQSFANEGVALYQGANIGGSSALGAARDVAAAVLQTFTRTSTFAAPLVAGGATAANNRQQVQAEGTIGTDTGPLYYTSGTSGAQTISSHDDDGNARTAVLTDALDSSGNFIPLEQRVNAIARNGQRSTISLADFNRNPQLYSNHPQTLAAAARETALRGNVSDVSTTIAADGSVVLSYDEQRVNAQETNRVRQEQERQRRLRASSGGALGLRPATTNADGNFFTGVVKYGDVSAAIQLLDQFGDAKVLSSPRISALNNQPALLRVVDQEVYFNVAVTTTPATATSAGTTTVDASENTVDVGFSMNILSQISEDGEIMMNLKPSVTRVLDYVRSPDIGGAGTNTSTLVPLIRARELETVISLRDGEVAVLGGLLEDRTNDSSSGIPGLNKLPGVGKLFEKVNQRTFKTEFIVFVKASIISDPSLHSDYASYKSLLPTSDFIHRDRESTLLPPGQEKAR